MGAMDTDTLPAEGQRDWKKWDSEHEIAHRNALGAGRAAMKSKNSEDWDRASTAHRHASAAFAARAHDEFAKGHEGTGQKYAHMAGAHMNASIDAQTAAETGNTKAYQASAAKVARHVSSPSSKREDLPLPAEPEAREAALMLDRRLNRRAGYKPQPYDSGDEAKEESVTCPNCGKGDAPDALYCDQCGYHLAADEDYHPKAYDAAGEGADEDVECPECHKMDAPDAKFCDQCGFKLEGASGVKVRAPGDDEPPQRPIGMGKKATPGAEFAPPGSSKPPFGGNEPLNAEPAPEPRLIDAGHAAFFKHDTSVAESHKAIHLAATSRTIADRDKAAQRLYDAAKGHKHASREILGLRDSLRQSPQKGSGEATTLARRHRAAARALEKAARTGAHKTNLLIDARKAVDEVDAQASQLATTLGGVRSEKEKTPMALKRRPGRRYLADVSLESLEREKRRREGPPPRSIAEIRSAIHRGQPITPAEQAALRESMKPAESGDTQQPAE